jgi:hypothetical protein
MSETPGGLIDISHQSKYPTTAVLRLIKIEQRLNHIGRQKSSGPGNKDLLSAQLSHI